MRILVTGGAGYIGSHTALALCEAGYEVTVYDNLSTGFKKAVRAPAKLVIGDLAETKRLEELIRTNDFSAILHFAGSIVVPESVSNPLKYYLNNTNLTTELIHLAIKYKIPRFLFSSTAAVYGRPEQTPVTEKNPLCPINPYGRTKLMSEWVLTDAATAHPGLSFAILRYFNVAGADPLGRLGQNTPEATHLIKVAAQTALGQRQHLHIFGTDYPTPDGTCIRDYIHVTDLAEAHVCTLKYLEHEKSSGIFNCGYGRGYSVHEIVNAMRDVSEEHFAVKESPRRLGDPAILVADATNMRQVTGWRPRLDDLHKILQSAYHWEKELLIKETH